MKKEWFFDRFCGEQIAVYVEDGKIVEASVEDDSHGDVIGNIYKGKVANVVPGMRAAFVSCGLERNCYLSLDEGGSVFDKYDGAGNVEKALSLKEGDELLVQMVKPPRGNKGAKVSAALSFVGKNLIFLPRTDFLGISRKITDEPLREALLKEADKLRKEGEGLIVRTAGLNATKRQLKTETEYLRRVSKLVYETAQRAPVGKVVYRESDLLTKVMRDSFGDDVDKIYVGNAELYEKLLQMARLRTDVNERFITLYTGEKSLFAAYYHLDEQIFELASTQIHLSNGAYLVVELTEAMTVFDVNTGKYTGELDLESTVFETNLLAAREVARQVRLRNLGGIIAIDFIDMTEEEHRVRIERELSEALSSDRAKCRVLPMSDVGVMLLTRKRTNKDISSFLLQPCEHCTRQGFVLSDIYLAMRIRSAVMNLFSEGYTSAIVHLCEARVTPLLLGHYFQTEFDGVWRGKRIYLVPHAEFQEEKFEVTGEKSKVLSLPDNAKMLY